nr:CHAT domain-containing tetratricopeptide repeat protein [Allomuricauda sp.]
MLQDADKTIRVGKTADGIAILQKIREDITSLAPKEQEAMYAYYTYSISSEVRAYLKLNQLQKGLETAFKGTKGFLKLYPKKRSRTFFLSQLKLVISPRKKGDTELKLYLDYLERINALIPGDWSSYYRLDTEIETVKRWLDPNAQVYQSSITNTRYIGSQSTGYTKKADSTTVKKKKELKDAIRTYYALEEPKTTEEKKKLRQLTVQMQYDMSGLHRLVKENRTREAKELIKKIKNNYKTIDASFQRRLAGSYSYALTKKLMIHQKEEGVAAALDMALKEAALLSSITQDAPAVDVILKGILDFVRKRRNTVNNEMLWKTLESLRTVSVYEHPFSVSSQIDKEIETLRESQNPDAKRRRSFGYPASEPLDITAMVDEGLKYTSLFNKAYGISENMDMSEFSGKDIKMNESLIDSLHQNGIFSSMTEEQVQYFKDIDDYLEIFVRSDSMLVNKVIDKTQAKLKQLDSMGRKNSNLYRWEQLHLATFNLLSGSLDEDPINFEDWVQNISPKTFSEDEVNNLSNIREKLGQVFQANYYYWMFHFQKGEYEKALEYGLKLAQDEQNILGSLILPINYMCLGDYDKAEYWYTKAIRHYQSKEGTEYSVLLSRLGLVTALYGNGKYEEAIALCDNVSSQAQHLVSRETDSVQKRLYNNLNNYFRPTLAFSQAKLGYTQKADSTLLMNLKQINQLQLSSTIYGMDASLQNQFNNPSFLYDYVSNAWEVPFIYLSETESTSREIMAEAYNTALVLKELFLNSDLTLIENAIENSDSDIQRIHKSWIDAREQASDINFKNRAEKLDYASFFRRELEQKLGDKDLINGANWKKVQNALGPNEAAIEFVNYGDFAFGNLKKKDYYAALLVTKSSKYPQFIPLFKEDKLKAILKILETKRDTKSRIEGLYEQKGAQLYSMIWKPLEGYLNQSRTVYYSPSGLLHGISFSALVSADDGTYLGNVLDLVQLSSTKNLLNKKLMLKDIASTVLFGGLEYDFDKSVKQHIEETWNQERKKGKLRWKPLPGALEEISAIRQIMQSNGIASFTYSGEKGLEDDFYKSLTERKPDILHIATHGFYEKPVETASFLPTSSGAMRKIRDEDDAMNHSGIVFTGANHFWKKGEKIRADLEDGIVTGNELASLDLRDTELVVLSACDTGIGKVNGNEGVFGLQRGLKLAGAKRLLVSLWKVDDKVTKEYMEAFYDCLINKKYSIAKAQITTQEYIREKYPDPYYWAAFVLIL